jgi:hypothetical protein
MRLAFFILALFFYGCTIKEPTAKQAVLKPIPNKNKTAKKPIRVKKYKDIVIVGCDSASLSLAKILKKNKKDVTLVCNKKDIILQPFLGLYLADLVKDSLAKVYIKSFSKRNKINLINKKSIVDLDNSRVILKDYDLIAKTLVFINEPKIPFNNLKTMQKIRKAKYIFIQKKKDFLLGFELYLLLKQKYPKLKIDFSNKPKNRHYDVKIFAFEQNSLYESINIANNLAKKIIQNYSFIPLKNKKIMITDFKKLKAKDIKEHKEISLIKYLKEIKKLGTD